MFNADASNNVSEYEEYDVGEAAASELVNVDPNMLPESAAVDSGAAIELVEVDPSMPLESAADDLGIVDDPLEEGPIGILFGENDTDEENAFIGFLEIEYLDADAIGAEEVVVKDETFNLSQLNESIGDAANNQSNASDCFIIDE